MSAAVQRGKDATGSAHSVGQRPGGQGAQRLAGAHAEPYRLLCAGNAELARLRVTRGRSRRSLRRLRRALAQVALATAMLGLPMVTPASASIEPEFETPLARFGLVRVAERPALSTFGDIDGDGDIDALVSNRYTVALLENTGAPGSPAFADPVEDPFGTSFYSYSFWVAPALVDVDGDGDLDVLVGNGYGDSDFFENTGTANAPAFAPSVPNPFGLSELDTGEPTPTFADLDGDGDVDAVIGTDRRGIFFFENTGTAGGPAFANASDASAFGLIPDREAQYPAFADLDGDGDLDALIGGYRGTSFFENTGTASSPAFAAPVENPFGLLNPPGYYAYPTVTDLDGDGDIDVVLGTQEGHSLVFENTGTPNAPAFDASALAPFGLVPGPQKLASPAFGDLDADGDLDCLWGARTTIGYRENTGTKGAPDFAPDVQNPFGLDPSLIDPARSDGFVGDLQPTLADVDGDGDLDAWVGGLFGSTHLFENTGTPSTPAFAAPVADPFGLTDVKNLNAAPTFGDFDGDLDLDVLIGRSDGTTFFFENTGTRTGPAFARPVKNAFGLADVGWDAAPELGDVDRDGDLDVVMGNEDGDVFFFENTGDVNTPAFALALKNSLGTLNLESRAAPALADLDGDGDLDAVVGQFYGNGIFFENVAPPPLVFLASPTANPFGLSDVGLVASPELADLDGDGDLDALIGTSYGDLVFFENTGSARNPAFAAPATNPFGLANAGGVAVPGLGDLDGDGDVDFVVGTFFGNLSFFENTGTPSVPAFSPAVSNPFGLTDVGYISRPELADLDGDGDLDALIGNSNGEVVFFENTGTTSQPAFAPGIVNALGLTDVGLSAAPSVADLDVDGDFDVLVGSSGSDMSFFENTGTRGAPAFAPATVNPFGLGGPGPTFLPAFSDLDGDGDSDVLIGQTDGTMDYFENLAPSVPQARTLDCPPSPTFCSTGFEANELLVDERRSGKERLSLKLGKGPAIEQADLGNPLVAAGAGYTLCLYDDGARLTAVVRVDQAGRACGTKQCWKSLGKEPPEGRGFLYKDRDLTASGVSTMQLKGGDAGRSTLKLKARNNDRKGQTDLPTGVAGRLASSSSVTAQLHAEDRCYSATLTDVKKQGPDFLKIK